VLIVPDALASQGNHQWVASWGRSVIKCGHETVGHTGAECLSVSQTNVCPTGDAVPAVALCVVGGAGSYQNPAVRNFPLINRQRGKSKAAHLRRVVQLVEEAIAAGGTHLLVPREHADWLENHPLLVEYFAACHELAEASPETGIVFRLLQPNPVVFTVEEDGPRPESTGSDEALDHYTQLVALHRRAMNQIEERLRLLIEQNESLRKFVEQQQWDSKCTELDLSQLVEQGAEQQVQPDLSGGIAEVDTQSHERIFSIDVAPGIKFKIVVGAEATDELSNHYANGGGFLYPRLTDTIRRTVGQQGRILDVGAHIGGVSLATAALGYEVLAIEASPRNTELLRASVELNQFSQLLICHAAAADEPGILRFFANGPYGHVRRPPMADISNVIVPAIRIDDLLDEIEWERPDFIKLDIEGFEPTAIRGIHRRLVRPDAPPLYFESNVVALRQYNLNPSHVLGLVQSLGYRTFLIREDRFIPVDSDFFQAETLVDYLALKTIPADLTASIAGRALTYEEIVADIITESRLPLEVHRLSIARALADAPEAIRTNEQVRQVLRELRDDPVAIVRSAASWSSG
jgi:FkbM family methyltransferase